MPWSAGPKKALLVVSGLAGALYCIAVMRLSNAFQLTPRFPAYAGEEDFNLRFAHFLIVIWPGFVALGAWIGYRALAQRVSWLWSLIGAMLGTALHFLGMGVFADRIAALATRRAANMWEFLSLSGLLALTAAGAIVTPWAMKLWARRKEEQTRNAEVSARHAAAIARATAHFNPAGNHRVMGGRVLAETPEGIVVRVMYMTGHIPPDRAWFLVGDAEVRALDFEDVRHLETGPWR